MGPDLSGRRATGNGGQAGAALQQYQEAGAIDDRWADLHFRMARCCLGLGKNTDANKEYVLAHDLDALRFRADTRINAAIREVVHGRAVRDGAGAARVHLVDAEAEFAAMASSAIPGEELFLEHVHMNFTGTHALASSLFKAIVKMLPASARDGGAEPAGEQQCAERLAYGPWNRYKAESIIREMLSKPPFTQQLDRDERAKRWDARLQALAASNRPEKIRATIALHDRALQAAPDDWTIRANYARVLAQSGDVHRALEQYYRVLQQVPHHYAMFVQMGKLYLEVHNLSVAKASFEAALALDPDDSLAHYELAKVLAAQGKHAAAVAAFTRGVQKDPNRAEGLALLANFLLNEDRPAEARKRLDEALQLNPDDATVHIIMGHLLVREGDKQGAIAHYEAAVRSKPGAAPAVAKFLDELK